MKAWLTSREHLANVADRWDCNVMTIEIALSGISFFIVIKSMQKEIKCWTISTIVCLFVIGSGIIFDLDTSPFKTTIDGILDEPLPMTPMSLWGAFWLGICRLKSFFVDFLTLIPFIKWRCSTMHLFVTTSGLLVYIFWYQPNWDRQLFGSFILMNHFCQARYQ